MAEAPPWLSIVIPTRDTRELTLRCLDSLAGAGGLSEVAEIILVDDGAGGDGTAHAVAVGYPEVRVMPTSGGEGFTAAAGLGIEAASGELLLLLNSDTEVDPEALDALAAAFAGDPRLGVAGARLRYPDGRAQWSAGREPGALWLFGLASGLPALAGRLAGWRRFKRPGAGWTEPGGPPVPVGWVSGAALAMRRAVWEAVGPLDTRFRFYAQDLDLCLRAGDAGWRVAVVPGFTVVHHHGATIGRAAPGRSTALQDPALLWADLVRWAESRGGPRDARRAAAALGWGARVRLAGRAVAGLAVRGERRSAWRRQTAVYRAALAEVRSAAGLLPRQRPV
jgi:GT2 family glycosyltransferase